MKSKGFTLIELLVTVSIIAILSIVGLVVFTDAQKKSRDAKRVADVDAIVKAFETNYDPVKGLYSQIGAEDFSLDQIPTAPEGTQYDVGLIPKSAAQNTIYTGFRVCARLEGNLENQCIKNLTNKCYCRDSSQGERVDEANTQFITLATAVEEGAPPVITPPAGGPTGGTFTNSACNADVNGDGAVNSVDVTITGDCFGDPLTGNCTYADIDQNGVINNTDRGYVQEQSGQSCQRDLACENFGDMNTDSKITMGDVRVIANSGSLTTDQRYIADVNFNGSGNLGSDVGSSDATQLKLYLEGTNSNITVCSSAKSNSCQNAFIASGRMGDVSGDGKVTHLDRAEASRIGSNQNSLYTGGAFTNDQKKRADTDYTGGAPNITSEDLDRITGYVNDTNPDPPPFPACSWEPFSYVFATSETMSGDIKGKATSMGITLTANDTGLTAADKICKQLADSSTVTAVRNRNWMAWLSADTGSPSTRFNQSGFSYRLVDGTTKVANNWADLTDGSLVNPLNRTENNVDTSGSSSWTNTTGTGTVDGSNSYSCGNWTSGTLTGFSIGKFGRNSDQNTTWTKYGDDVHCGANTLKRLYCFEQ